MFGMGTGGTPSLQSPKARIETFRKTLKTALRKRFRILTGSHTWIARATRILYSIFTVKFYGQAERAISNGQLNALPHLHIRPIDVVVFHGPSYLSVGRSHLGEGFTLICVQRLSRPDFATQLCHWRDNWITRGLFNPVLSY